MAEERYLRESERVKSDDYARIHFIRILLSIAYLVLCLLFVCLFVSTASLLSYLYITISTLLSLFILVKSSRPAWYSNFSLSHYYTGIEHISFCSLSLSSFSSSSSYRQFLIQTVILMVKSAWQVSAAKQVFEEKLSSISLVANSSYQPLSPV